ncbi:MAG TPA: patatin-like phospholipase family protein [Planctomycetaceae bacterium]|nr:patatin-like phospholipase family protein [Planctomycetaceae bacterium]
MERRASDGEIADQPPSGRSPTYPESVAPVSGRQRVAVAFSGGGFRATLFHLGVLLTLIKNQMIDKTSIVLGVSGGAVLAGLWASKSDTFHWPENPRMLAVSPLAYSVQRLVSCVRCDLRNRVFRRWLSWWVLVVLALYLGLGLAWSWLQGTLNLALWPQVARALLLGGAIVAFLLSQRYGGARRKLADALLAQYDTWLFNGATLGDVHPYAYLTATSLTDGSPFVAGNGRIAVYKSDWTVDILSEERSCLLARAVAASSAFPPAFSPVQIEFAHREKSTVHFLTDGGVFDNLGVLTLLHATGQQFPWRSDPLLLIVSDAGPPLQVGLDATFTGFIRRNARASDVLMHRVADSDMRTVDGAGVLHLEMFPKDDRDRHWPGTPEASDEHYKDIASVRTDLDQFTEAEVVCLVEHGAETAFHYLSRRLNRRVNSVTESELGCLLQFPRTISEYRRKFHGAYRKAVRPNFIGGLWSYVLGILKFVLGRDWICFVWSLPLALVVLWEIQAKHAVLDDIVVQLSRDDGGYIGISVANAPLQPSLELQLIGPRGNVMWHKGLPMPSDANPSPWRATMAQDEVGETPGERVTVRLRLISGKHVIEEVDRTVPIQRE